METIKWKGFGYSVNLSRDKANELWEKFKAWTGSQKEFYFKFVNKAQLKGK